MTYYDYLFSFKFQHVSPNRFHELLEKHEEGKRFIHCGLLHECVECDPMAKKFTAFCVKDERKTIFTFLPKYGE